MNEPKVGELPAIPDDEVIVLSPDEKPIPANLWEQWADEADEGEL